MGRLLLFMVFCTIACFFLLVWCVCVCVCVCVCLGSDTPKGDLVTLKDVKARCWGVIESVCKTLLTLRFGRTITLNDVSQCFVQLII